MNLVHKETDMYDHPAKSRAMGFFYLYYPDEDYPAMMAWPREQVFNWLEAKDPNVYAALIAYYEDKGLSILEPEPPPSTEPEPPRGPDLLAEAGWDTAVFFDLLDAIEAGISVEEFAGERGEDPEVARHLLRASEE